MLSLLSYKLINGSSAWGYNNIFNILAAMYLFLYFSKVNVESKIINYTATYYFSIYIIHINPLITKLIYDELLKFDKYYNSIFILAYIFIATLIIFIICILAEFIRRLIFKIILDNKYLKIYLVD